jgi:hypothetical protein
VSEESSTGDADAEEEPPEEVNIDVPTATMIDGLYFMGAWRDEFLTEKGNPPEVLFHYTSTSSLIQILESNELWATNAVFMNDEKEISHAAAILKQASDDAISDPEFALSDPDQLLKAAAAVGTVLSRVHDYVEAYVTCFCTKRDLLSQWRGYGDGGGASIGISSAELCRIVEDAPFRMEVVQVTYDADEQ